MPSANYSEDQQRWIAYAFTQCGIECVLAWEGESAWILDRKGNKQNTDGSWDWGLCQLNNGNKDHRKFIHSKAYFDPYQQLDYCISVWKDAQKRPAKYSPWYAYRNIAAHPKARADIMKRFTIIYK